MWPHTGSWGTPDFGLTELLAKALGAGSTNQNGSDIFPNRPNQAPPPKIDTRTNTINTGGGAGYSAPAASGGGQLGGGDQNGVDLARQAYDQRVNAIRDLFGQTKQRATDIRSEAETTFADLLKAVGAFRERAGTQFSNAGQEITNNASELLGTNARTAQEQEGDLRAKGRALGLGDSSKFQQQTGLAGRLAATQGNTLSRRGEENRSNRGVYDERLDQAQGQEDEAGRYKTSLFDEARRIENTGVDQFGDNLEAANNTFGSSLNNILNYQRQLAAIQPLQAGGLSQYTPDFSGIQNTITNILGGGTPAPTSGGDIAANLAAPTTIAELLKRNRGLYA